MNSQPMLDFLSQLTGIERLVGDPYLIGGGLHQIQAGGFLKLHTDFNKHSFLDLDRRLNVIIYLNEDWEESYGGISNCGPTGSKPADKSSCRSLTACWCSTQRTLPGTGILIR